MVRHPSLGVEQAVRPRFALCKGCHAAPSRTQQAGDAGSYRGAVRATALPGEGEHGLALAVATGRVIKHITYIIHHKSTIVRGVY